MMVAICHSDFCQKRTGSVFQVGAYFAPDEPIEVRGETKAYNGLEIDGVGNAAGASVTYNFCPTCGSTAYWVSDGKAGILGIAAGNIVRTGIDSAARRAEAAQDASEARTGPSASTAAATACPSMWPELKMSSIRPLGTAWAKRKPCARWHSASCIACS